MLASARPVAVCLAVVLVCGALVGCADSGVEYAGQVVDDAVVLSAPYLPVPSLNLDAGFAPSAANGASQRSTVATAIALTGIGSVSRVTRVSVRTGSTVRTGEEIARFDARALDTNVSVAIAGLAAARAQVGLLDDALETVASNRSTLASKRAQIDDAAAQLASTRAKIARQRADLKKLLARIEAMGPGGGQPPVPPGSTPPTGPVPPPGPPPPGTMPDPAALRAGVAKLTVALARIDAGLAKVSAGREQLASASAKLGDARSQLKHLRRLAIVGVDAAKIGVQVARYQGELAVVRSPVDGVVVSVAAAGDALAPGATVATLRRIEAPRVTTWVSPESLVGIIVGTEAEVRADWFPGGLSGSPLAGRVTSIGTRAEYPPTSLATSEIHLTRAIRVETTLSNTAEHSSLPPGVPVDVRFFKK